MFGLSKRMLTVIGLLVLVVVVFVIRGGNSSGGSTQSSGQCQMQVTADVLNVRSSPADNAAVVQKLASGTMVSAEKTVQGTFRELGTNRWAATQFLKAVSGDC